MEKTIKRKKTANRPPHGAKQKAQAVLSVWTEKRKSADVCRELNIPWNVLSQWQNRAMEGMLQALEPRVNLEQGTALSPRLLRMLEKKASSQSEEATIVSQRLEKKLATVSVQEKKESKTK